MKNHHPSNHMNLELRIFVYTVYVDQLLEIQHKIYYINYHFPFFGVKVLSPTLIQVPSFQGLLFPSPSSFIQHFLPEHPIKPSSIHSPHIPTQLWVVGEYRQTHRCKTDCDDLEDRTTPSLGGCSSPWQPATSWVFMAYRQSIDSPSIPWWAISDGEVVVAGAYWRQEITENELRTWQAEISLSGGQRGEELRRLLSALPTVLNASTGMQ